MNVLTCAWGVMKSPTKRAKDKEDDGLIPILIKYKILIPHHHRDYTLKFLPLLSLLKVENKCCI